MGPSDFKAGACVIGMVGGTIDSTVASVRLSRYIARILDLPLYLNGDNRLSVMVNKIHTAIIVNGPMLYVFAGHKEKVKGTFAHAMLKICQKAPNIVWVQNDYDISPPAPKSKAKSLFRKAWSDRELIPHYWTTVKKNAKKTELSAYVNWNKLTYNSNPKGLGSYEFENKIFYYGAYRRGRIESFNKYLIGESVAISTTSKRFESNYPDIEIVPPMTNESFYPLLHSYGLGLYLEDKRSHKDYHSPANRFYEMLSAGLPMVFDETTERTMKKAGYDVSRFICDNILDVKRKLHKRNKILKAQQAWRRDYHAELKEELLLAAKELRRGI